MSLTVGQPAEANAVIVAEAVRALWDGKPRRAELADGRTVVGRVWEVYRSIGTSSLRVRMTDNQGRVQHFNSLSCLRLEEHSA